MTAARTLDNDTGRLVPAALLLTAVLAVGVAAQRAEFDVASVKVHTSNDSLQFMVAQPGGRFVAANVPLRMLIRTAFQLQEDQIVGGPGWMATERFDIEARAAESAGAPTAQLLAMLRSLLEDRFGLIAHRERRELPVFALERAKAAGPLGAGLRPTECPALDVDLSRPQPCTSVKTGLGSLTLRGMPLNQLTPFLSPQVNRVLVDRTGLDGRYDIDLKWTPEQSLPGARAGEPRPGDADAVSILTALQEQLGLKLTATRDTVDVLVIDTVEQPTPN
jgi:uncharacterized protein (TIGR03435 family)